MSYDLKKGKRSLTFSEEKRATDKKGKNKKLIHTVLGIQARQMTKSKLKPLNPNSTHPPLSNKKSYFLQPLVIELPPKNLSIALNSSLIPLPAQKKVYAADYRKTENIIVFESKLVVTLEAIG